MIMWGVIVWWYTDGWRQCLQRVKERIDATLDYFSFDLLIATLFAPFRQISAGSVRGPFDVQVRAFFDRLISRVIGMLVRLFMILIGSFVVLFNLVLALLLLIGWMVVPLLPVAGLYLFLIGWQPWN